MSHHNIRLETLFSQCDTSGTGLINSEDFQDLCAGFGIEEVHPGSETKYFSGGNETFLWTCFFQGDSDIIFADLDHDGDGKINFEDFSFGFRDFLTPGSRRGSLQLGLLPGGPGGLHGGGVGGGHVEEDHPKLKSMEVSSLVHTKYTWPFAYCRCNEVPS